MNNQIRRTNSKEFIQKSLIFLLEDEKSSELSIKKICEKAGVSRNTFYRHFTNVYDVVYSILYDIDNEILINLNTIKSDKLESNYKVLCDIWYKYRQTLGILLNSSFNFLIPERLLLNTTNSFKNINLNGYDTNLLTEFFSMTCFIVLKWWSQNEFKNSPNEVTNVLLGLLNRNTIASISDLIKENDIKINN